MLGVEKYEPQETTPMSSPPAKPVSTSKNWAMRTPSSHSSTWPWVASIVSRTCTSCHEPSRGMGGPNGPGKVGVAPTEWKNTGLSR